MDLQLSVQNTRLVGDLVAGRFSWVSRIREGENARNSLEFAKTPMGKVRRLND